MAVPSQSHAPICYLDLPSRWALGLAEAQPQMQAAVCQRKKKNSPLSFRAHVLGAARHVWMPKEGVLACVCGQLSEVFWNDVQKNRPPKALKIHTQD